MFCFFKRLLLSAVVLTPMLLGAQTVEEEIKKVYLNAYNDFGKRSESVPLHFIFVIDISDSNFGPEIVKQLAIFSEALPKNDYISIIQLGNTEQTLELVPTSPINDNILKAIKAKFQQLVDEKKFGTPGSDGFKMIGLILEKLKQQRTQHTVPFVYVFSDLQFYHPRNFPSNEDWMKKKSEFKDIKFRYDPTVTCYMLKNPNPNEGKLYKQQFLDIFPSSSFPDLEEQPELTKQSFKNIQIETIGRRLNIYINQLKDEQINNIKLTINQNGNIELIGADTLVYHKLILNESSKEKVNAVLNNKKLFSFFPPSEKEVVVSGTLVAEKYKKELPQLADIELKEQKIKLMDGNSLLPWWLTDIIVLILGILLFRFIWTLLPVSLHGMITFSSPDNFDAAGFNANCSGKKFVTVGYGQAIANDPNMFGSENFSLKITACRKFFKGKCLELAPLKGDIKSKRGNIVIQKSTKSAAGPNSRWAINGVDIGMPGVK